MKTKKTMIMSGIIVFLFAAFVWVNAIYQNVWPTVSNYSSTTNWVKNPDTASESRFASAITISGRSAIKDNFTNLYWEASPSTSSFRWGNDSSPEPTWNGSSYDYGTLTADNYPAFEHCVNLWSGWRLPTINELLTLLSYVLKNDNNASTAHPALSSTIAYWSSTVRASTTVGAWNITFNYGTTYAINKGQSFKVVCVHD
jgi:hypothetical protein